MQRRALLATTFLGLALGCATPNRIPVLAGETLSVSDAVGPHVDALPGPEAADARFTDVATDFQAPPAAPRRPRQRFSVKGGYYGSSEDGIDDGYIINLSWMRPTSGILSSEVEIGYLDASGTDKGVDRDMWSIPVMANGRFDVPVGERFEVYGGLGLGTFYYDVDAKTGPVKVSGDGFLFGGDAFFGGTLHLGQDFCLGLEGKYYVTDNASDLGGGLDAYVVLLTLGFER